MNTIVYGARNTDSHCVNSVQKSKRRKLSSGADAPTVTLTPLPLDLDPDFEKRKLDNPFVLLSINQTTIVFIPHRLLEWKGPLGLSCERGRDNGKLVGSSVWKLLWVNDIHKPFYLIISFFYQFLPSLPFSRFLFYSTLFPFILFCLPPSPNSSTPFDFSS